MTDPITKLQQALDRGEFGSDLHLCTAPKGSPFRSSLYENSFRVQSPDFKLIEGFEEKIAQRLKVLLENAISSLEEDEKKEGKLFVFLEKPAIKRNKEFVRFEMSGAYIPDGSPVWVTKVSDSHAL